MFLLAGWYFFAKQKEAVWVTVDRNYDYIMKNDPIGQNASAKFHYYTLVLSWSPAFCDVPTSALVAINYRIRWNCNAVIQKIWLGHSWFMATKSARMSRF